MLHHAMESGSESICSRLLEAGASFRSPFSLFSFFFFLFSFFFFLFSLFSLLSPLFSLLFPLSSPLSSYLSPLSSHLSSLTLFSSFLFLGRRVREERPPFSWPAVKVTTATMKERKVFTFCSVFLFSFSFFFFPFFPPFPLCFALLLFAFLCLLNYFLYEYKK